MNVIRFFRIYDIGKEIDLHRLENALARSYYTARANFQRIKPKSIMIEDPPLLLRMHPTEVTIAGARYELIATARIYDIGVISLCFEYEFDEKSSDKSLEEISLLFVNDEAISDVFASYLKNLHAILRPHISDISIDSTFFEDYFIYFSDDPDSTPDPAILLLGENTRFSSQMREEALKIASATPIMTSHISPGEQHF